MFILWVSRWLAGCQVWLTSGLVLLPISNLIESAPHYLQSVGNTAFITITTLLALNIFVINPNKCQDKIFEVVLKTCKSIHEKQAAASEAKEFTREEKLASCLHANSEVGKEIYKEIFHPVRIPT